MQGEETTRDYEELREEEKPIYSQRIWKFQRNESTGRRYFRETGGKILVILVLVTAAMFIMAYLYTQFWDGSNQELNGWESVSSFV